MQDSPWFYRTPDMQARVRLFVLPHAGGGAGMYARWRALLPAEIALCPVLLPGRERRISEPAHRRMARLLDDLGPALEPWLHRPFALFGHSMGGLIAFALTRWLRRHTRYQPIHLLPSARVAPQLPRSLPNVHQLADDRFIEAMNRYGGMPAPALVNAELMALLLPTLKADMELAETYQYSDGPALDVPITAFGGARDTTVSPDQLAGWRVQTTAAFTVQHFDGGHFFLHEQTTALVHAVERALSKKT